MNNMLYNAVDVTTGINGYPKNLYHATTGFSTFSEAEDYARENDGEVVLLHRKDGWDLWENQGHLFKQPERTAEEEGDDYALYTKADADYILEQMKDLIQETCESFDTIKSLVYAYEEIFDSIDACEEGEGVLVCGNAYHSTIELHPMQWHDTDNNQYIVAVVL